MSFPALRAGGFRATSLLGRVAVFVLIIGASLGLVVSGAGAQGQNSVVDADFSSSADGFSYSDVSDPTGTNYVSGAVGNGRSGNGLTVTLGGVNGDDITNMIGAWTNNFTLSQPAVATINVDYRIEQSDPYDPGEWAEARIAVDGTNLAPNNGNFPRVEAGGTAGWATYTTQVTLSAGNHTIELIGVNNEKTWRDETTVVRFDNVSVQVPVVATPTPLPTATSTPVPAATATPMVPPTPTPLPGPSCGGGALAQEAEDGTLTGTMVIVSDNAASGSSFVQAQVGTRGRTYPNTDVAEYCVTVPTSGDYRLDATVWAPSSSDDSFYVTIDGGTMALWDMAKDPGFHDDSVSNRGGDNPVTWNLSAGDHIVRFHHREDGAGIDKFELISLTPTAPIVANCTTGVQQAETGALNGTMQIVADGAAAGGQFVQAQIGTYGRPGPGTDYAEYCVTVPTGGDYRIDATAWAPNSADDSFYVTIDNTPHALWDMNKSPTFATSTVSDRNGADPMIWNLTPGNHTIRFHHREDGAGIDSFELILVTPPTPTPIPPTATPIPPTATPIPPTPTPAPDGITLFDGTNQNGALQAFAPGVYSGANGFATIGNNKATSFAITAGHIALVCTNGAGTGTCRGFTNSKNNLGDFSLNNNISYLQIRQIGDPFILAPGNDLTQMVNRLPAGMDFVFTPGVYNGQSIVAKDDMTFTGQAGAILDGNGIDSAAITGYGDRVEIRGLEIRNYEPGLYNGAIQARNTADFAQEGNDWLVENNDVHNNNAVGVNVGSGMTVRNNRIYDNFQIGISGIGNDNNKLTDVTIDDNEVFENANDLYAFSRDQIETRFHEGGLKIAHGVRLKIINNNFHDNHGIDIYCDVRCDDVLIDNNDIAGSTGRIHPGSIVYEISSNATISNNRINSAITQRAASASDVKNIMIMEARDVLIENNTIAGGNTSGHKEWAIGLRGSGNSGERRAPTNVTVRGNTIRADRGTFRIGSASELKDSVQFSNNTYIESGGSISFRIEGNSRSWSQWRATGRDVSGSSLN